MTAFSDSPAGAVQRQYWADKVLLTARKPAVQVRRPVATQLDAPASSTPRIAR